jgi:hypothetical protein
LDIITEKRKMTKIKDNSEEVCIEKEESLLRKGVLIEHQIVLTAKRSEKTENGDALEDALCL